MSEEIAAPILPQSSPWRRARRFCVLGFLVVSFLPIWQTTYIGDREATGELGTFWEMVIQLFFYMLRGDRSWSMLLTHYYGEEFIKFVVVFAILLLIGRWIGGRELRWMEKLSDPMHDPRPL